MLQQAMTADVVGKDKGVLVTAVRAVIVNVLPFWQNPIDIPL